MKYKKHKDDSPTSVETLVVFIGENRFRLTETTDGNLHIIKFSDGESDLIRIHPHTTNEIELS